MEWSTFRFTAMGSPVEVELEQSGAELSSTLPASSAPTPFFLALLSCVLVILRLCSHAGKYVLSSIEHMEISTQTYTSKYK